MGAHAGVTSLTSDAIIPGLVHSHLLLEHGSSVIDFQLNRLNLRLLALLLLHGLEERALVQADTAQIII